MRKRPLLLSIYYAKQMPQTKPYRSASPLPSTPITLCSRFSNILSVPCSVTAKGALPFPTGLYVYRNKRRGAATIPQGVVLDRLFSLIQCENHACFSGFFFFTAAPSAASCPARVYWASLASCSCRSRGAPSPPRRYSWSR